MDGSNKDPVLSDNFLEIPSAKYRSTPSGKWFPCCSVAPKGRMATGYFSTAAATASRVSSNASISTPRSTPPSAIFYRCQYFHSFFLCLVLLRLLVQDHFQWQSKRRQL